MVHGWGGRRGRASRATAGGGPSDFVLLLELGRKDGGRALASSSDFSPLRSNNLQITRLTYLHMTCRHLPIIYLSMLYPGASGHPQTKLHSSHRCTPRLSLYASPTIAPTPESLYIDFIPIRPRSCSKMMSWMVVVGANRLQMGMKPRHSVRGPSFLMIFTKQSPALE